MSSKEEIEKAKEFLWDIDDYYTEHATDENGNVIDEDMNEKAEKINNANYYIMQLEQEKDKLNKIVDEMAEQLAGLAIWNIEKNEPLILGDKEEVKKYYERKAANE